jgi:pilus assembly protein CpaB
MNQGGDTAEKGRGLQLLWKIGGAVCLAVACAVVASHSTGGLRAELGGRRALGPESEVSRTEPPPSKPTAKVLVTKKEVPAFKKLKEPAEYFEVKEMPEEMIPKNALKSFDEVKDERLKANVNEGHIVTKKDLLETMGEPSSLGRGPRLIAVGFPIEEVPPGLKPGSRVDLEATVTRDGKTDTRIFLKNVPVRTVSDPWVVMGDAKEHPIKGQTLLVTLETTPEDAQRVSLASALGKIRLILRSPE